MRIQHNIMAMNSYRNFTNNNKALSKNLEKLSSGYRINRAGDDAAGLAISEKMRAQITGLKAAQKNAKDGISLVQTAEGSLTEVHSMLNRMLDLADQSANGTFDNDVDRKNLQKEFDQLRGEIDRISDSTNFNGIKLLDGSLAGKVDSALSDSATIAGVETLEGLEKNTQAAVAGKYETTLSLDSAKADGSTDWLTANSGAQVELILKDTNNNEHTLKFIFKAGAAALKNADVASALDTLLKGGTSAAGLDAEFKANNKDTLDKLGELFSDIKIEKGTGTTAGSIKISAESAAKGSAGVGLASITLKQSPLDVSGKPGTSAAFAGNTALGAAGGVSVAATTTPKDEYTTLTGTGDTALTFTAGDKLTVGDHTFEIKAGDDYEVEDGNVRVVMGKDDTETLKNLVAAMKDKGIDAKATADGKVRIDDASQLKTSDKKVGYKNMVDIKSGSLGVTINTVEAKNASETYDIAAGSAGVGGTGTADQKLGIGYVDQDGNAKTLQVDYKSTGVQDTDGQAIADAINKNADTKGLFKATYDASTDKLKIESLGGDGGVELKSLSTTDTAAGAIAHDATASEDAVSAGKSVTINNSALASGDTLSVGGKEYQFLSSADLADPTKIKKGATAVLIGSDSDATTANLQAALANDGVKGALGAGANANTLTIHDGESLENQGGGGLTLQIGDTTDSFNQLTVAIEDMHTKALGLDLSSIALQEDAGKAVDAIKTAINSVSSNRGTLGSLQNRLDHTINNLSVMHENIQDAEASIRDVDVAEEMMDYTKNNILVQSAQAMLAQANQVPQGVLQLLG